MSRIHEALKKAEQERAAIQGGTGQASFATTPVAEPPVYVDDSVPLASAATANVMPGWKSSGFANRTIAPRVCATVQSLIA